MKRVVIYFLLIIALVGVGFFWENNSQEKIVNDNQTQIVEVKKEDLSNSKSGTMIFVGDVMLSRSIGILINKNNDVNFPFLKISDFLKNVDLTFGNLEDPVSSRGTKVGSIYSFRADPKVVEGLKSAGFDVVSVANNHIWDYARPAFLDTLTYLKDAGINPVGAGLNFKEAHDGVLKEINGAKIVFLAYTDLLSKSISAGEDSAGVSYLEKEQVIKDVQEAKKRGDIVIVSFHFGDEYQTKHNLKQEEIAKAAIDAGASFIVGHHPHVVQEVEQYKNGWIAYSLGNFVFDQNFSEDTGKGLALKVFIKDGRIQKVENFNIVFTKEFQPMIAGNDGKN